MSAPTKEQYEACIRDVASVWRARSDAMLDAGWAPAIAFAAAADEASGGDCPQEATIQQMTFAASRLHAASDWRHHAEFSAWWNERFADAPLVDDFRAPCLAEIGGQSISFIAPWGAFVREWRQEGMS